MSPYNIKKILKITVLSTGCFVATTQSLAQPNLFPDMTGMTDITVINGRPTHKITQNTNKTIHRPVNRQVVHTTHYETRNYTPILTNGRFQSREHFVRVLLPHAIHAGKTLGVDPKIILAQAALESNWGQSILRHSDKRISHNIFSIKHTSKKGGHYVTVNAKEFRNGKARYQTSSFRSYNNFKEAFEDYTRIIQKAHYRKHMHNLRTPLDYATSLQRAGYATDPKYAKKIMQKYHDIQNIQIK